MPTPPGISLTLGISFHLEYSSTPRTSANVTQDLEEACALMEWPLRAREILDSISNDATCIWIGSRQKKFFK